MPTDRKSECLADLRARILTLEIEPGASLDETTLSEAYGLSRTPLREIFQRLAGEGFITIANNRGATVASMNLDVMRTFFQTAPLIYSTMARLATEHRTADQLDELAALQDRFKAAVAGARPTEMSLCNHRFHELIGEMAANEYLTPSLRRLLIDHTRVSQMFYRPAAPMETMAIRRAADQHDEMIAAIEARDAEAAVALTLAHWDLTRDRVERYVRPDPLPLDMTEMKESAHAL